MTKSLTRVTLYTLVLLALLLLFGIFGQGTHAQYEQLTQEQLVEILASEEPLTKNQLLALLANEEIIVEQLTEEQIVELSSKIEYAYPMLTRAERRAQTKRLAERGIADVSESGANERLTSRISRIWNIGLSYIMETGISILERINYIFDRRISETQKESK